MSRIQSEKLAQACELVAASSVDVWLTFVRETADHGDPVLPFLIEGGLTWQSALMVSRSGRRVAVVGNFDADPLRASGDWDLVVPYVQSIREPLLEALEALCGPEPKIAVNYSLSDPQSDGLTHGMWECLQEMLQGTRFERSLVGAEPITMPLRSVKTDAELELMRAAIAAGDRLFEDIARFAKVGTTERAVYDLVHRLVRERGLGFSWDPAGDPIVNSGPDSMIGHGVPSDSIAIQPGHVFHIDLGVTLDGYSSDIQRSWYVLGSSETEPPADVLRAFRAVHDAITAGANVLRAGMEGWEVDAAARRSIVESGFEEFQHALGHQVGRVAHDGGAILGPKWERYGHTPCIPIPAGSVFTLELGVVVPGRGYLGLEEMVRVAESGVEWLSRRQDGMLVLGS